jgi:DNA-binding response OmpR family regulator
MKKILLLEDDIDLSETIGDILIKDGYEVTIVNNGYDAADETFDNKYDLYIFDINVPDMNGLQLLESLRKVSDNTPTIIISALIDIDTIKSAFDIGADNYIKKPFFPEELLIYINLKLKPKKRETLKYNDLEYDINSKLLRRNGEIIHLGKVQLNIFDLLINNIGVLIEKEELLNCLDKYSEFALRTSINKLKKNTGINIKNIRGIGYIIDKS